MKNILILIGLIFISSCRLKTAHKTTEKEENNSKVIVITLDGLRWKELFSGADSLLIANKKYVRDTTALKKEFWRTSVVERRKALFPFFWKVVAKKGQLHGNRDKGSKVNITNKMHFSYPGYNEILTGKPDDKRIYSNDKLPNPNITILEYAQNTTAYKGRVAAFGSWDVFPYIINQERSGIYVNAGFKIAKGKPLTEKERFLNELQSQVISPWHSVRLDAFTHHYALETLKKEHPKLIYIAYGEIDDFAHDGAYDAYLKSAKITDNFIKQLWNFVQNDSFYKNQTTFIITTDHGRGTEPIATWKSHGSNIKNADQVWLIALGNKISSMGEITENEQLYTNQIAATIAKLLNIQIPENDMGKPFSFLK